MKLAKILFLTSLYLPSANACHYLVGVGICREVENEKYQIELTYQTHNDGLCWSVEPGHQFMGPYTLPSKDECLDFRAKKMKEVVYPDFYPYPGPLDN